MYDIIRILAYHETSWFTLRNVKLPVQSSYQLETGGHDRGNRMPTLECFSFEDAALRRRPRWRPWWRPAEGCWPGAGVGWVLPVVCKSSRPAHRAGTLELVHSKHHTQRYSCEVGMPACFCPQGFTVVGAGPAGRLLGSLVGCGRSFRLGRGLQECVPAAGLATRRLGQVAAFPEPQTPFSCSSIPYFFWSAS